MPEAPEVAARNTAEPERQDAVSVEEGATGADVMQDAAPAPPDAARKQATQERDELRRERFLEPAPTAGAAESRSAVASAAVAACDPGGDLVWPKLDDSAAQQRLRTVVERAGGRLALVPGQDEVWSLVVRRPGWEATARELVAQGVTAVDPSRPPAGEAACLQVTLRAPGS